MVQLTFLFSTLLAAVLVQGRIGNSKGRHARAARIAFPRESTNSSAYKLIDIHEGKTFFQGFDFFSAPDPTNGLVTYLPEAQAYEKGLAYVQDDNVAVIAVDDTTTLDVGGHRNSVRLESKKTYNGGLIIADFFKMPHGCGVWPAWWTVGPSWPTSGEIDILEGVHEQKNNQYTLHTAPGCTLNSDKNKKDGSLRFTGNVGNVECASSPGANSGCILSEPDERSYGTGFNMQAGGAYAVLWDTTGIRMWFFPRSEMPADVTARNPDPTSWGTPNALFSSDRCDIASHFYEHKLVLNTALGGDWAGGNYEAVGCPGTMAEAITKPENFIWAKWKVNYIAVYDK